MKEKDVGLRIIAIKKRVMWKTREVESNLEEIHERQLKREGFVTVPPEQIDFTLTTCCIIIQLIGKPGVPSMLVARIERGTVR